MAGKTLLRQLSALAFLGVVPIVGACGGHVISLGSTGTNQDQLKTVPIGQVGTTTSPCPTGYAHPNICCAGGPKVAAACGAWENDPFRACDTGSTTYPNPLSCCSLTKPGDCIDTPPPGPTVPPAPPSYGCGYACPPGWWAQAPGVTPNGPIGPTCCQIVPGSNGVTQCESPTDSVVATPPCVVNGTGGSGGGPTPIDAGPAPDDGGTSGGPIIQDGGAPAPDDASCPTTPPPPDPGFDGGTGSLCGACPAGWKSDPTQPEVCCTTTADGTNECFSQASGPVGSIGLDGGSGPPTVTPVGPPGWGTSSGPGTNGPSCTGTTGSSCSCEQSTGGHAYALDCYPDSSGIFQCTCSVDKASQSTFASKDPTYCNDSSQIEPAFTAPTGCNFP